jgi:flagellar basal-body rod protein FlgF
MDRLIYTAMSGAKQAFLQQAGVAQNLANVSTTGYRAMEHRFRAVPILGAGQASRAFTVDASVSNVFDAGPLLTTGRPLDVALQGEGWIAVQASQWRPRPTPGRATSRPMPTVVLQTSAGLNVLGEGGPISLPPDNNIVDCRRRHGIRACHAPALVRSSSVNVVGRIKLVNPPESDLVRGDDGLFRTRNGVASRRSRTRPCSSSLAALEGSNVNSVDAMVQDDQPGAPVRDCRSGCCRRRRRTPVPQPPCSP